MTDNSICISPKKFWIGFMILLFIVGLCIVLPSWAQHELISPTESHQLSHNSGHNHIYDKHQDRCLNKYCYKEDPNKHGGNK